ncbi:hypothetical protein H0H92_004214 [Tricholoma furcatifolium]|nr:hypothetical protein H0H92_004214 [Tricholoma furcatifolium]
MDNTVEKHIAALGQSGVEEWSSGGTKLAEWVSRKEQWKKGAVQRAKAKMSEKPQNQAIVVWEIVSEEELDENDYDVYDFSRLVRTRPGRAPQAIPMSIVFSPAILDTVHVPINSSSTTLKFTATLNTADYDTFQKQGARIQLWSNIPVDGDTSGNWSSCDFESDLPAPVDPQESVKVVSLSNEDEDENHTLPPGRTVLSLRILLPQSNNEQEFFSFTYRILYSSGEIRWLGEFGRNGALILKRADTKVALGLSSEWTYKQGGYVYTRTDTKDIPVIRISKPEEYVVCSLGSKDSHRILPAPEYLVCSVGNIMRLQPENIISISGNGPLFAFDLPRRREDLLLIKDTIMRHCSKRRLVVTAFRESLVVTSTSTLPVQGIVLRSPRESFLSITADTLRLLLSSETPPASFALYTLQTHEAHLFIDRTRVALKGSGQFMLSPAYNIAPEVYVAIISLYTSARLDDTVLGALPTPPPSPELLTRPEISPCPSLSTVDTAPSVSNISASPNETEDSENSVETSTVLGSSAYDQISKFEPRLLFRTFVLHMDSLLTGSIYTLIMVFRLFFEKFLAVTAHDEDEPEEAGLPPEVFHSDAGEEPGSTERFSSEIDADKSNKAKVLEASVMTLSSDFNNAFPIENIANDALELSIGGADYALDSENLHGKGSSLSRPQIQAQLEVRSEALRGRRELSGRNLELGLEKSDMRLRKALLVDIGDGDRYVKLAVWQGDPNGKVVVELNGKRIFSRSCTPQARIWDFEVTEAGFIRISYDCDAATKDMKPIFPL